MPGDALHKLVHQRQAEGDGRGAIEARERREVGAVEHH